MLRGAVGFTMLISVAVLVAGGLAPAAAQPLPANLVLPDTSGTVPQVLRLPLDIAGADSVIAITIDVVFDSTVVRPQDVELGAFGAQVQGVLWGANTINDTLRVVFATPDTVGYLGSGTLVTIEWELVAAGTSPLDLVRIDLERHNQAIPFQPAIGDDGSVIAEPQAIEPTTWGRLKRRYGRTP